MEVVHKVTGYKTSLDYERLAELMQSQSVVCIVDSSVGEDCRDIAHTIFTPSKKPVWQICCRGTCYVYAWDVAGFVSTCKNRNVEFIVPNNQE